MHRFACGSVVTAVLALLLCQSVSGDECGPCATHRYCAPENEACATMALERRCWASHRGRDRGTVPFEPPAGYPLPIGLQNALGPGDFPPRKLDPHASSAPLVSAESRHGRSMPSPFAERPTQNDLVDLITGQPLYQEIDFELPFGSAMFRHVRTHAPQVGEQLALDTALNPDFAFGYNPSEWFWDWNGRFWMMSENPLLLVDASYQFIGQPDTQITYFIPDSHHAVPFVKQSTGQYVAPPWFDGTLTARSEGSTTYFDVRTQRGSVTFTFKLPSRTTRPIRSIRYSS